MKPDVRRMLAATLLFVLLMGGAALWFWWVVEQEFPSPIKPLQVPEQHEVVDRPTFPGYMQ